jgi:hypothetical protein
MIIINQNTVVVFTSSELKEALENDNGYTYIYLGSDITLSSGIAISNKKSEVIIDGTYNNVMYNYIDQKKLGTSDGIYVTGAFTSKVTVKNINITGYNYYGVIYVSEASAYKNTTIEYSKVTYVGPQISYNPMGITRFLDSVITIKDNYASGNEVAECNQIEIGGNTTIIHNSTGNSSFWFRNSSPSFTILSGASVYFTSTARELFYGVTDLVFTISKNASFYVSVYNGLAYGTFGTGTTIIDENATFSLNKTHYSGSYPTWYSYGTITLNKGSTLNIINNYENITSSNYNILFSGNGSGLILNNPEKVVLYNSVGNVISARNNSIFDFTYNRINLFNTAISITDDISKDTLPTYSWYKSSELSKVSGTFTSAKTTVVSNNYTEEEMKNLPSLSNFNIIDKKILSIGTFFFCINPITEKDTTISGTTRANASILIEYEDSSVVVNADENGDFSYSYSIPLPVGTVITFTCKYYEDLLYYTKQVEVVYSGELLLDSATKSFQFETYAINKNPVICPRLTNLSVRVIDSRINSSDWKLYAAINHEMESDYGIVLGDSLVFVDESGDIKSLSDTPTLVYTGKNNGGSTTTTDITWEENKGILLRLNDPLENNVKYSAQIIWTIEE